MVGAVLMRLTLTVVVIALLCACGAQAAEAPPHVYSIRTERGAKGHTLTTVAFPVTVQDEVYLCVVTEDQSYLGRNISVAQSCDFGVSR